MKIDWKRKLSSRKFWAAVASWITSILGAFCIADNIIAQVVIIVSGIGALAVYMLAETAVDKASVSGQAATEDKEEEVVAEETAK